MADNMIYTGLDDQPINPVMDRVYSSPMDAIREGAEDVHVRTYVAYGKTDDHKLYLESTYTTQIDQADIEYAFKRGMLVIYDGTDYIVPVSLNANTVKTVGTVSSAVAFVEWTAKATV